METARRVLGILLVVGMPPAIAFWLVIHPFARWWRQLDVRVTYALLAVCMTGVGVLLFAVREPLLGRNLGTNWLLIGIGAVLYLMSVAVSLLCRRRLSLKIFAGVPEVSRAAFPGQLLQEGIYGAFTEKFTTAVKQLTLGNGWDEGVTTGPLINRGAVRDVHNLVQESVSQGAKITLGGQPSELGECFYEPTIMVDVTNDMPIAHQEIFGPVAPILKFGTEKEAIEIANDTEVGLAAYIYTRDIGRIWRVSEALEYGMVGINEGIISNEAAPFGGVKESGQGREGSKYGIDDYVEIKYLCMGGIDS